MKRAFFWLPLCGLIFIACLAFWALTAPRNLQAPPSQLIGKTAPPIMSKPLEGYEQRPRPADSVYLVNFFASYCVPCIQEHKQLKTLSQMEGVEIIGITFNDQPENADKFLKRLGNPFLNVYHDSQHSDAIAWGVNAIPTTFVVSPQNKVFYRHDGAINQPELLDVMQIVRNAGQ